MLPNDHLLLSGHQFTNQVNPGNFEKSFGSINLENTAFSALSVRMAINGTPDLYVHDNFTLANLRFYPFINHRGANCYINKTRSYSAADYGGQGLWLFECCLNTDGYKTPIIDDKLFSFNSRWRENQVTISK